MATDLDARVFTVSEAARLLRISDRLYYGGVSRGELPAVRIGRRLVVPGAQLARLLEGGEVIDASNGRADDEGSRPREAFREP